MFEFKQTTLLIAFTLATLAVLGSVTRLEWQRVYDSPDAGSASGSQVDDDSYFKIVRYFVIENETRKLDLKASELVLHGQKNQTTFFNPVGFAYTQKQEAVEYSAGRGLLQSESKELSLWDDVSLTSGANKVFAQEMFYQIENDYVVSRREVKTQSQDELTGDRISISADEMDGRPRSGQSNYKGNVQGVVKRRRAYEPPVNFSADQLRMDLQAHKVELQGNVSFEKQELTATSLNGEIFLENYNKKLKYFALYDDVKVVEKVLLGRDLIERRAFAERLEGFMSENLVVLTGYPKVFQQQDVIKGNRIILRENNEVVEVEDANTNFRIGN